MLRFTLGLLLLFIVHTTDAQLNLADKNIFEFRGVWVATVENIDWPSKRGLSNEDQKENSLPYWTCIKKME